MTILGKLRVALFGVASVQAVFGRPGFTREAWERFHPVACTLIDGYNLALEDSRLEVLLPKLEKIDETVRGFAYEGAGMGVAPQDIFVPWNNRVQELASGPGGVHMYPIYVGVGQALAHLKRNPERFAKRLDPLLGWVVVDGYGFYGGLFAWKRTVEQQVVPKQLSRYGKCLFDQGLGRAICFASGGDVRRVIRLIEAFPVARQVNLWTGVGFLCTFAGGADRAAIEELRAAEDAHKLHLARGAAVAANARLQTGSRAEHTDIACRVLCGMSCEEAAQIADKARENIPDDGHTPMYEIWLQRIQAQLSKERDTSYT
jgi:hypothetical protein